jgi:transcription elongation GreA/GreB family factor
MMADDNTTTTPQLSPEELNRQKIQMWADKLKQLQAQFDDVRIRRGEAAREGDLRENAAYIDLTEQAEVLSARINDIQKMIAQLEEAGAKKDASK